MISSEKHNFSDSNAAVPLLISFNRMHIWAIWPALGPQQKIIIVSHLSKSHVMLNCQLRIYIADSCCDRRKVIRFGIVGDRRIHRIPTHSITLAILNWSGILTNSHAQIPTIQLMNNTLFFHLKIIQKVLAMNFGRVCCCGRTGSMPLPKWLGFI